MAFKLGSNPQDTVDLGRTWFVDFKAGKNQLVSFDKSHNSVTIDANPDEFLHAEKSSFKMLRLSFSSKLNWGFYIASIAKTSETYHSFF